MATLTGQEIKQLVSRLHEQTLDVANLQTALDVQVSRISHLHVEPESLPSARQRRQPLRALLTRHPTPNGKR